MFDRDDPGHQESIMNWAILALAGLLEVIWAVGLKQTAGFTKPWPSAITIAAMVASLYLLSIALRTLPLGTAYAVWVGIGAVGTMVVSVLALGEPASVPKLASVALILAGIVGLKLAAT
jgi:quaternary ammonium compound-resistance protein SugE